MLERLSPGWHVHGHCRPGDQPTSCDVSLDRGLRDSDRTTSLSWEAVGLNVAGFDSVVDLSDAQLEHPGHLTDGEETRSVKGTEGIGGIG